MLAAPPAVPVKVTMPPLEEMDGEPENSQIPWLPVPAPPPVPVTVTAAAPAMELPSLTRTPAELVPPAEPPVPVTWILPLVEEIFPKLRQRNTKVGADIPRTTRALHRNQTIARGSDGRAVGDLHALVVVERCFRATKPKECNRASASRAHQGRGAVHEDTMIDGAPPPPRPVSEIGPLVLVMVAEFTLMPVKFGVPVPPLFAESVMAPVAVLKLEPLAKLIFCCR